MSRSERQIASLQMQVDGAIAMCDHHARMLFTACESLLAAGLELSKEQADFHREFKSFQETAAADPGQN